VVTNSGEDDETVVFLYDGQKIVETRNGSAAVGQQSAVYSRNRVY
jgi:hypothetical protein